MESKQRRRPLDSKTTFGVELELSLRENSKSVYKHLDDCGFPCAHLSKYEKAEKGVWKVTDDSSIECCCDDPRCQKVELVSPILRGGKGLSELNRILTRLNELNPAINKSMGVHVHIGASKFSFKQRKKICQQFIRFEEAFDLIVPKSRRENKYCKSNRELFAFWDPYAAIEDCKSMEALISAMSYDRYRKLNLQAYKSHKTFEFRQHSGSTNYRKVSNWIRLLVAFCNNSAKIAAPEDYESDAEPKEMLNLLLKTIVKDPVLTTFYQNRSKDLEEKRAKIQLSFGGDSDTESESDDESDLVQRVLRHFENHTTLSGLQEIIRNLRIRGNTSSISQCKKRLKGVYINIYDYVQGRYDLVYKNKWQLMKRCNKIGTFPLNRAKETSLKNLLKSLFT